jgi:hypothetical protein
MNWIEIFWNCDCKGATLPQVLFKNPDWFFYMIEEGNFKDKGSITQEAEDLGWKARHILIPGNEQNDLEAEYTLDPSSHSFASLEILPRDREVHSRSERMDVIDLSFPRKYKQYDKLGNKLLLKQLIFIYFRRSNYRMTRDRCEAFFENEGHFRPRG